MSAPQDASVRPFIRRLMSRSIITRQEQIALSFLVGKHKIIPANVDIVRHGMPVDHAYLVVDGLVGRFGQTRDGNRQLTSLYIPGDMVNLSSLIIPSFGWGSMSLTRSRILEISHADLKRLMADYPGVAEAFWRDGVADTSITSQWVVNLGRRNSFERLAHLICEMAIRYEQVGLGERNCFRMPLTQIGISEALGLTAVHTNRTLRALRTQLIAKVVFGLVEIFNWDALVSAADFDDALLLLRHRVDHVSA